MKNSRRGVSGELSGWVKHVHVAGQQKPTWKYYEQRADIELPPPPGDAHQNKEEGERLSPSPSQNHRTSSMFESDTEM